MGSWVEMGMGLGMGMGMKLGVGMELDIELAMGLETGTGTRLILMPIIFFSLRFVLSFSANLRRITPAMAGSRPCASRNEFTSPSGTQIGHPLLHWRSSDYCRFA